MPLSCPGCGVSGWVDWNSLKNGIACPKCGCEFLIGRNGQVQSKADLPHRRFRCPRCRHAGAIPTRISSRGAACPACKLPLAPGPDGRLHAVEAAADLWSAAGEKAAQASARDRLVDRFVTSGGRIRASAIGLGGLLLFVVLLGGAIAMHWWFDQSCETLARQFVFACLSGQWDRAEQFMADDPVQKAHFARWRVRYFTSILDSHRPRGDRVRVDVLVMEERPDSRVLGVSMKSAFLGTRSMIQQWRLEDGRWQFDARQTVREPPRVGRSTAAQNAPAPLARLAGSRGNSAIAPRILSRSPRPLTTREKPAGHHTIFSASNTGPSTHVRL
jgi:hypothetical protein